MVLPVFSLPVPRLEEVSVPAQIRSDWRLGSQLRRMRDLRTPPRRWRASWPAATLGEFLFLLQYWEETAVLGAAEITWTPPSFAGSFTVLWKSFAATPGSEDSYQITIEIEELLSSDG